LQITFGLFGFGWPHSTGAFHFSNCEAFNDFCRDAAILGVDFTKLSQTPVNRSRRRLVSVASRSRPIPSMPPQAGPCRHRDGTPLLISCAVVSGPSSRDVDNRTARPGLKPDRVTSSAPLVARARHPSYQPPLTLAPSGAVLLIHHRYLVRSGDVFIRQPSPQRRHAARLAICEVIT
jgi:hypothetical protein